MKGYSYLDSDLDYRNHSSKIVGLLLFLAGLLFSVRHSTIPVEMRTSMNYIGEYLAHLLKSATAAGNVINIV